MNGEILLEVQELQKHFNLGNKKILKAVDKVSFTIKKGETLGIVGESGCGKTTCARTCIGLYPKTSGKVLFNGKDIHQLNKIDKKAFAKQAQIIFQDPYSSLDPKMKVSRIIAEGLRAHNMCKTKEEELEKVNELLITVGLNPEHANRYVHEFSGGQRQRIGIARALAVEPEFIVCDEPISALDVSIQAQIVNLLMDLQKQRGLTYLFIAHDLSMVKYISTRVGVMYLGVIVELTKSQELYKSPKHPYTQALLSAIPIPDPEFEQSKNRIKLTGELPSPLNIGDGCRFKNRCSKAMDLCQTQSPQLKEIEPEHFVACHLY